ncbi:uncharacterized protein LOC110723255 isoform X2 [Chenopodium quinoa]|uniref:uncharacterized protein LOC110723255 isoform X2 n=1 Tax=Chenopodium quinoa TaxID=63459 RepID=UPI000B7933EF|nr:uncharacterized protein LOC110723255 isoform X2 [Chenopodium quinoa]
MLFDLLSLSFSSQIACYYQLYTRKNAPENRLDPGWEHATEVDKAAKKVWCNYYGIVRSGGIFRLKHHIPGTHSNVEACFQVPDEVKQKIRAILHQNELESAKKKRKYTDIGDDDEYNHGDLDGYVTVTGTGTGTGIGTETSGTESFDDANDKNFGYIEE